MRKLILVLAMLGAGCAGVRRPPYSGLPAEKTVPLRVPPLPRHPHP